MLAAPLGERLAPEIKPQLPLAGGLVRSVALEAMLGQDWPNLSEVTDGAALGPRPGRAIRLVIAEGVAAWCEGNEYQDCGQNDAQEPPERDERPHCEASHGESVLGCADRLSGHP